MKPFICLITDGGRTRRAGTLERIIIEALEAGEGAIGWVQLREEKGEFPANSDEVDSLVRTLRPICDSFGAKLLLNNRVSDSTHGVQLGVRSSVTPSAVRKMRGAAFTVGYSAHELKELEQKDIDLFLFAPIFRPLSKTETTPPLGLEVLSQACNRAPGKVFALGGITESNVQACRKAGAAGVGLIGSIMHAVRPAEAVKKLLGAWYYE